MDSLTEATSDLVGKTSYCRTAFREKAPLESDCLTSVHYVFKRALGIDIPLTYVGDMPRRLLSYGEWRLVKIDLGDAKCGDILFVRNKKREKLLSHVAIVLGVDQIFHCCSGFGTAVVQTRADFFSVYEQMLSFKGMIRYIDPRNRELREAQKGMFLFD